MNPSEVRTYKGTWWLPASPEDEVSGYLTLESDGSVKLELIGAFGLDERGYLYSTRNASVIYGRCYDPDNKVVDISLFECRRLMRMNFSSAYPIVMYTCRYALIGINIESLDEPVFFRGWVDYDELTYWCPPHIIQTVLSDSQLSITVDTSRHCDNLASLELEGGIVLHLVQSPSYFPKEHKITIGQSTLLEICKESVSALQVLSNAQNFERFLSVATLRPVEHTKVLLFSRNKNQVYENDEVHYDPIELVSFLYRSNNDGTIDPRDFLFGYEDVSDDFGKMYNQYCSNKSIAQIWTNLIASLERKKVFTSNDFLVVVQALDGFSIRFRTESGFLQQLKDLRDEFKPVKNVSLTDEDLARVQNSRNYYTHILRLEVKDKRSVLDGNELYHMTKKLRVLLICCIMDFLGLSKERINTLISRNYNSIIRVN